jgi:rhodanese-related sulfurtransferase
MDKRYRIWSAIAFSSLLLLGLAALGLSGCYGSGSNDKSAANCASGVCKPPPAPTRSAAAQHKSEPAEMNTAALLVLQRAGVKLQLLEARPDVKDVIPGARRVSVTLDDADILKALPDKQTLYVTYCASARCSASAMLARKLQELGYRSVIEFRQGWAGWREYRAGKDLGEPEINAAALNLLMKSGASMKVFDARTGKYDDGRRVPGAGNLSPMSKPANIARAIPDQNQLVVTYCTNLKCPASRMLAKHLRKLGYKNVIEYPHGIEGWASAGYPVQKVK